jgi:hypothetical protein
MRLERIGMRVAVCMAVAAAVAGVIALGEW